MGLDRRVTDKRTGQPRDETAYAITSLSPARADAARLLALWRGHWAIENRLHYVRDVTFGEDACTTRSRNGPRALAALRNTALALLRLSGATNIAAARRRCAARPALAIAAVTRRE